MQDDEPLSWGVPGIAQLFESVLDAASERRDLSLAERDRFALAGSESREQGMTLSSIMAAYLDGSGELWEQTFRTADPADAIDLSRALRRVSEQAVACLAEGYEAAQRRSIRIEETQRREFLDDLLTGVRGATPLGDRAMQHGFPFASEYGVLVAAANRRLSDGGPIESRVRTDLLSRAPGRRLQIFTKQGQLVVIAPGAAPTDFTFASASLDSVSEVEWHAGVGARADGLAGIASAYTSALEALRLARTFDLPRLAVFDELLTYRLIAADREVAELLVERVLGPLVDAARGSLLGTLGSFIENNGNMAEMARDLSVGARTVAYRLDRIARLTGHSPRDADGRFVLELAYRAAPSTGRAS